MKDISGYWKSTRGRHYYFSQLHIEEDNIDLVCWFGFSSKGNFANMGFGEIKHNEAGGILSIRIF